MLKKNLKLMGLPILAGVFLSACSEQPPQKKDGEAVYYQSCFSCHERGHGGAPKRGDMETWQPRLEKGQKALMQSMVQGYNAMPPKGACFSCSEKELQQALDFMLLPVEPQ